MHMADALLSPTVGGTMWAATAGTIAWCSRRVKQEMHEDRIPLMGVLGAFIFAAQMINFSIPGTGSSGHLGGGMILAALLGSHAAFLVIASVLLVQALFFADGGLLALGCNIFNLGFFPSFLAYPLVFRPITGNRPTPGRILAASLLAAVFGLQLGAFAVVLQTVLSGVSALPFTTFLLLMQPIHLAIGVVEGLATALIVSFVWKARPEILAGERADGSSLRRLAVTFGTAAMIFAAALSWFASSHPDGLEWAISKIAGSEELAAPENGIHSTLAEVQETTSLFPDYGFREDTPAADKDANWPAVDPGTSSAGMLGGVITLVIAAFLGWLLRRRARKTPRATGERR